MAFWRVMRYNPGAVNVEGLCATNRRAGLSPGRMETLIFTIYKAVYGVKDVEMDLCSWNHGDDFVIVLQYCIGFDKRRRAVAGENSVQTIVSRPRV